VRDILLDTGAFVALLDKSERNHERCVMFFKDFKGKLFTTEPVLAETIYLLGPSVKAQKTGIEFILRGGAMLVPQSMESLSRAVALMERYKDIPMDFADATLVSFAEETEHMSVTLDIRASAHIASREKNVQVLLE
jgi:predicted nucleic acid-binding protein